MDNIQKIKNILKEQNSKLSKWKEELKKYLSKNTDKKIYMDFFLIRKKWLEKYEKKFFNNNINDKELIKSYYSFEKINNENLVLSQTKDIKSFPEFFPLNKICWNSFQRKDIKEKEIYLKGYILNNLLLLEVENDSKTKLLWIFFYDKKDNIGEGYLIINDLLKEKKNNKYSKKYFGRK